MGISGAAVAAGPGYSVTAVVGLFVFGRKKSLLHFWKPVFRWKVLANAAGMQFYSDNFSFLMPSETSQVVSSISRSNGIFRPSATHWK